MLEAVQVRGEFAQHSRAGRLDCRGLALGVAALQARGPRLVRRHPAIQSRNIPTTSRPDDASTTFCSRGKLLTGDRIKGPLHSPEEIRKDGSERHLDVGRMEFAVRELQVRVRWR